MTDLDLLGSTAERYHNDDGYDCGEGQEADLCNGCGHAHYHGDGFGCGHDFIDGRCDEAGSGPGDSGYNNGNGSGSGQLYGTNRGNGESTA
jgi:hypothetical protein